jgi:hypothetical protein
LAPPASTASSTSWFSSTGKMGLVGLIILSVWKKVKPWKFSVLNYAFLSVRCMFPWMFSVLCLFAILKPLFWYSKIVVQPSDAYTVKK